MIEFLDHGRWCVLSPSDSSFVWRNRAGEIATVEEIRQDPEVFTRIYARYPHYPFRFDNPSNIRWDKLPKPVQSAIRIVTGPEGFAHAQTPRLYDMPRQLFFTLSATGFASFGLMTLLARRSLRRSARREDRGRAPALGGSVSGVLLPADPTALTGKLRDH